MSRAPTKIPNPAALRELLDYDPLTGCFTWKYRDATWFINPERTKSWNSRFAGKPAFVTKDRFGYFIGAIQATRFLAHRIAYAMVHNVQPDSVDHIDGNPGNNRIDNLRSVSHQDNLKNQRKSSKNTSGVTGVYWQKKRQKWEATLRTGGKTHHLGFFKNFDDAVTARQTANTEYGFHENHGR